MKKLFSLLSVLFFSFSSTMKGAIFMEAVEAAAKGSLSNFGGESPDDYVNDVDGYMGIGDPELDDDESGFLGHQENGSTKVLSFTFANPTAGAKDFYLVPGFKNYSLDGTPATGTMQSIAGGFISIGGSETSKIIGTNDANCTLENFINWINENPTAFSGFKVQATSLASEGVIQAGQAEAQIRQMVLTLTEQDITGDLKPQPIRVGLNVDGTLFNTTIASSNVDFVLSNKTSARINVLPFVQFTIDLYINNSLSRSTKMSRMTKIARNNITRANY